MIKSYDAIEEHPKVSYTSEAVAKQILKKIVIKRIKIGGKKRPYSCWDLFMDHQLEFTMKGLKLFS